MVIWLCHDRRLTYNLPVRCNLCLANPESILPTIITPPVPSNLPSSPSPWRGFCYRIYWFPPLLLLQRTPLGDVDDLILGKSLRVVICPLLDDAVILEVCLSLWRCQRRLLGWASWASDAAFRHGLPQRFPIILALFRVTILGDKQLPILIFASSPLSWSIWPLKKYVLRHISLGRRSFHNHAHLVSPSSLMIGRAFSTERSIISSPQEQESRQAYP